MIQLLKKLSLVGFAAFTLCTSLQANELQIEGRVYNPDCPGYYSSSIADLRVRLKLDDRADLPSKVQLHYSFRNVWTQESWSRIPEQLTFKRVDDRNYILQAEGLAVSTRGRYLMSHLEFVIRFEDANGRAYWDNGQLAPMGFYSATLPALRCQQGEWERMPMQVLASDMEYRDAA